nr:MULTISPECIES: ABC transporter permease [Nocardia]
MLRRNLRHVTRYPIMMISSLGMPIIMLLMFVGVFGKTLRAGIGDTGDYVNYVAPAIIMMTVGFGSAQTAVDVNTDMTEGIIGRFRTMAIWRMSVLSGHALGSIVRTLISVALVLGVAVLIGFRPSANVGEWLAAAGVILLLTIALTWIAVGLGLTAKSPAGASSSTLLIQFLPFVSGAFVPPESMLAGVRWFGEYQPFTPIVRTIRGLLVGTPIGNNGIIAIGWCVGLALVGYIWARMRFNRDPEKG